MPRFNVHGIYGSLMTDSSVSVVIAACNGERFIGPAIESVLTQTVPPLEIIVVDDGSSDRTAATAASFAHRTPPVRVLHRNLGSAGAARNVGWRAASGSYVAILDQDDIAYPPRLQVQRDFLDANPDVAAVGGYCDVIDALGVVRGTVGTRSENELSGSVINTTMMVRREVLDELGGYIEIERTACEDADLILRIGERYRIYCIAEPLGAWRVHGDNNSANVNAMARWALAVEAAHRLRKQGLADPLDRIFRVQTPSRVTLDELGVPLEALAQRVFADHMVWVSLMLSVGNVSAARSHVDAARATKVRRTRADLAQLAFADALVLRQELEIKRMIGAVVRSLAADPRAAFAAARHPLFGGSGRRLYGTLPAGAQNRLRPVRDLVVRVLNGR